MQKEKSKEQRLKAAIKDHFFIVVTLLIIQLVVDFIFRFIYSSVNPIRASFIGLASLLILYIPLVRKGIILPPFIAAIPIFSSALFGALLVQAGVLVSKSPVSAIVHALILIFTYALLTASLPKAVRYRQ